MRAVGESAPGQSPQLRELTLHGNRVSYLDEGAGDVLLLIHGIGGSSDCWRDVVHRLSRRHRVIAVDLLGHGRSDKPRSDYSLGAFAVWLRDFLDALNIHEATVVGHSFGGGVALQFAHQHKEYCRRLVLISSGGLGPDLGRLLRMLSLPGAEIALQLIASRPAIQVGKALRRRALSSGQQVTRYSETLKGQAALSNRHSRAAFLKTLRSVVDHRGQAVCALDRLRADLPTMIIFGDQDRCIPVAHAYSAHEAIPGSELHVIPGVGHQPQVQCPETVARLVGDFIDKSATALSWRGARQGLRAVPA
ncbi:putative hydrolase or acyltransferase of alpha/beta superfamily [Mycolicibacterium rhodesiae NBB3]|uniref:Putative hydrolase or acyltransferase of alpha/beta superfamily n=1 Tax=Mycolicibacterium rhodesiae (strain NBB3) TaxID=710685 RepID=G8RVY7_MYCRN|nr:alpha/beta fold hydrolase [Mycolicibacterium rhodesiae]AEV76756.1 putative hydrolase or acyltransferase of alpha/beta superfamily [Mycolicibacterium rhodesiae NBB3]